MDTKKVTRFVLVDHRPFKDENGDEKVMGRVLDEWGVKVELLLQDDGKTLKVVVNERAKKNERVSKTK